MKKYLITGLIILLPLTITLMILSFIINILTKPFVGLVSRIFTDTSLNNILPHFLVGEKAVHHASQILVIISLFVFTLALGFITRWVFFNALIKMSDKILRKIPLINKVYKTTSDIIKTLFVTDKNSFKQVVLITFPSPGMYSIGFVSRPSPTSCTESVKSDLITVLVPTTPNPTTGFLLMSKKEDLVFLDMTTEEAIKYVVSCGVIIPGEKKK